MATDFPIIRHDGIVAAAWSQASRISYHAGTMSRKTTAKRPVLSAPVKKRLPARAGSVSSQVTAKIRESLLKGEIKAGDFLGTESTLVEHFGIGRSPMRDALRSLEAMGIIEIRAGLGGGVYVAEGNPDLFAEILAVQLKLIDVTLAELLDAIWAVEGMAVELAADKATDDDLATLQRIVDELAPLIDKPQAFVAKSMEFHAAMVRASKSRALIAQARMLHYILFRHYSTIVDRDITALVFDSLSEIGKQLAAHSRVLARQKLDDHYAAARHSMLQSQNGR